MNSDKVNILIVEDNSPQAKLMEIAIKNEELNCDIDLVNNGKKCLEKLAEYKYAAIVLDYNLPLMNGLDVLEELKRIDDSVPVIMVTGEGSEEIAVEAMKKGAYDYLIKRSGYLEILPKTVEKAIEKNRLETQLKRSELKYQTLVELASDAIFVEDLNYCF